LLIEKVTTSKLLRTRKEWDFLPVKAKGAEILGVFRAFITQNGGKLRRFSGITSLWSVAQRIIFV